MHMDADGCIRFLQRTTEQGLMNYKETWRTVKRLEEVVYSANEDPGFTSFTALIGQQSIHALTLLSEFYDYTGQYQRAAEILYPYIEGPYAEEVWRHLRHKNLKLYARLSLHRGRVAYHQRDFGEAAQRVKQSLEIHTQRKDNLGKSLSLFHLARIHHRQRKFSEAKACVFAAIEGFMEEGPGRGKTHRVALCHLLLSWVAFREGNLHEAKACLIQAQVILSDTEDWIHQGSGFNILGCIERANAQNAENYHRAKQHFHTAFVLYERAGHRPLMARVMNNLGHTYTRMGQLREAEQELSKALELSEEAETSEDTRTQAESLYFLARVNAQRKEGDKVKDFARQSIKKAAEAKVTSIEAEALVALARAILFEQQEEDETISQLTARIKKLNRGSNGEVISVKTDIAWNLLMAQVYCREGLRDRIIATTYHKRAVDLLKRIQNQFLSEWVSEVEQEIAQLQDVFLIPSSIPGQELNFLTHQERLRFWLWRRALERTGDHEHGSAYRTQVADLLGVKRQTVDNWVKAWRDNEGGKRDLLGVDKPMIDVLISTYGNGASKAMERT